MVVRQEWWDGTECACFVQFSANAKLILKDAEGASRVYNTSTGEILRDLEKDHALGKFEADGEPLLLTGCAFSTDGECVLSWMTDGSMKVQEVKSGEIRRSISTNHEGQISIGQIASDDKTIASGSDDGTIKLWDVGSGAHKATLRGQSAVRDCVFSEDGKTLVSCPEDGSSIELWDTSSCTIRHTLIGHTGDTNSCNLSPGDTMVLSGSQDKTLKIWSIASGKNLATCVGHKAEVNDCCFSPNGESVLSCSSDGTLKLWNTITGDLIQTLEGHSGEVLRVWFSPRDASTIVSGCSDGMVCIWNKGPTRQWQCRVLDMHSASVESLCVAADGSRLLVGYFDGSMKMWS
jgi:WD40 repeat protein